VSFEDIRQAHDRIRDRIRRTPVEHSRGFDERAGLRCYFKCENLQRGGAFKIRGATNFIFQLDAEQLRRGVVAYSSGTGAMEAAVSNLFSRGEKVICCSAGKFGERWVEISRAFGLETVVLEAEYGRAVSVERVAEALAAHPDARGVFVQASETSTGVAHDVRGMGEAVARTEAIFVVDAITGIGTMPLDIDGWGLDVVVGGSQKAFMIPPGLSFITLSPKAWQRAETANLPHYYFDLKKEKKLSLIHI